MTDHECCCEKCEELMQPFLDRVLSDGERVEAETHLEGCGYCKDRYVFEERFRMYMREACCEEMRPELKTKLAELRTPL